METTTFSMIFFLGKPREVLKQFIDITGHTLIPPPWSFSTWNQLPGGHKNMTIVQAAKKLFDMDIPFSHVVNTVHYLPKGKFLSYNTHYSK